MNRSAWRTAAAFGGAAAGLSAAVLTGVLVRRRAVGHQAVDSTQVPLGSLRGLDHAVVAEDGLRLYGEVDEPQDRAADAPTLVFVHGWALTMDSWHFQRVALREHCRIVLYDQRSHGRSARSEPARCTLDQLGRDLATVIYQLAPSGPLILVGHSMGGMTIMSFAEQFPDQMSDRVVGAALLSTSAGGVMPIPGRRGRELIVKASPRLAPALTTVAPAIEASRKATSRLAYEMTRRMGFGGPVPDHLVAFADAMIAANPVSVFADFYPLFARLDMHQVLRGFSGLPTLVAAGSRDAITPVQHSRRIAELIPEAELVIFQGAGHLVMIERHEELNRLLSGLVRRVGP